MQHNGTGRGAVISSSIRAFWLECERVMTGAAGPILIISSILQMADTFSGHRISADVSWLSLAWAVARAVGVTVWVRPSIHHLLTDREQGKPGTGWALLALGLSIVDIQGLLLYGAYSQHLPLVGLLGILDPGPYGWLIEVGLLGAILIIVHAVVDFYEAREVSTAAPTQPVQPTQPAQMTQVEAPLPPVAAAAFYPFPPQTRITGYDTPSYTNYGGAAPASQGSHSRRRDAGRPVENKAQRIERIMAALREEPNLTKREIAARFSISEATAYNDSREARRRLEMEV